MHVETTVASRRKHETSIESQSCVQGFKNGFHGMSTLDTPGVIPQMYNSLGPRGISR